MEMVKDKQRFAQLIKALESGWKIDEPVMLGATWQTSGKNGVYHFILRKTGEDKTTMVSLPPSPQLLVFLSENNISVNSV